MLRISTIKRIMCLVRAADQPTAMRKLKAGLSKLKLQLSQEELDRIELVRYRFLIIILLFLTPYHVRYLVTWKARYLAYCLKSSINSHKELTSLSIALPKSMVRYLCPLQCSSLAGSNSVGLQLFSPTSICVLPTWRER